MSCTQQSNVLWKHVLLTVNSDMPILNSYNDGFAIFHHRDSAFGMYIIFVLFVCFIRETKATELYLFFQCPHLQLPL